MADRDVDEINEEDVLQRMLNQTQDFDLRKKIRNRIKYLREFHKKQRDEEAKARQMASQDEMKRRAQLEDEAKAARLAAMSKRHESAVPDFTKSDAESKEAAKARQMKKFEEEAKTSQLGAKSGADAGTRARIEKADAQKEATMRAYGRIAEDEAFDKTITDVTTTKDASGTKTTTTTTTKTTGGFTKKPAGPPGGAKGARAAFQGMDAKTGGGAPAKPNFLQAGAGRGRGGGGVTRSPSAIKQMLLSWTQAMTKEYGNYGVNITNFSSSWNDGMAFCALIHHFYPDAFDFSTLDSKNRRANFTLAFDTAEQKADIAPLLEVEDMVRMQNPDWKCVFTYIQSIYKGLNDLGLIKIKSKK